MDALTSPLQALTKHFDTAAVGGLLGTFTQEQLKNLQATLASQEESLKSTAVGPEREQKLANLRKLRSLVQDTMHGSLQGLATSVKAAVETAESVTAAPAPITTTELPSSPRYEAMVNNPMNRDGTPEPVIGRFVPTEDIKNDSDAVMTLDQYREEIDPNHKIPPFLMSMRYWMLYRPFAFFGGLFGKKQTEAAKAATSPSAAPGVVTASPALPNVTPAAPVQPEAPSAPPLPEDEPKTVNMLDFAEHKIDNHTVAFMKGKKSFIKIDGVEYAGKGKLFGPIAISINGDVVEAQARSIIQGADKDVTISWTDNTTWKLSKGQILELIEASKKNDGSEITVPFTDITNPAKPRTNTRTLTLTKVD